MGSFYQVFTCLVISIIVILPETINGAEQICGGESNPCPATKIICYFTNWAINRTGMGVFNVSDIDKSLCTNIVYSFAVLNPNTLTIELSNPELDINQHLIEQIIDLKLKSKDLKVSLALGGWADSANSSKYSKMINDGVARTNFIHNTVNFLKKYNFDGLDLDWEYPKCWQGNCTAGPVSDKNNFVTIVRELHKAFRHNKFILSAAVSADRSISFQAYNFQQLALYLDWIGVETYDYVGAWSSKTGHHSPYMGVHPNSIDSIQLWLDNGVPAEKLVMGIPLYGRTFTLTDEGFHGVGAPVSKRGNAGEFTKEPGFLAYFEFCKGWNYHSEPAVGAYAFMSDQWVSFNDIDTLKEKARYVKQFKLAGIMIWSIDLDDYSGKFCNQGKFPLLSTLKKVL